MALNRPILDDRSYEQIRDDLIRRIPVYTPEWTDHNASDPGVTLLELFAYLGENLLYRFNQIPDAMQMEFLRLLHIPLRAAQPARALVNFTTKLMSGVPVPLDSLLKAGDVNFETRTEVRVLPVSAIAVSKQAETEPAVGSDEAIYFAQAYRAAALKSSAETAPYTPRLLWHDEPGVPVNFDNAVDGLLWVALLAEKADQRDAVRTALASHNEAPLLINIGFVPDIRLEALPAASSAEYANLFRCPGTEATTNGPAVEWQMSSAPLATTNAPAYRTLTIEGDSTQGLTQEGVVRLRLPKDFASLGPLAITDADLSGTGDLPPRLEDDLADRVVVWIRAFRHDNSRFGRVLYVGANAVDVVQTTSARPEFLGVGNGQPNQRFNLVNRQVIARSSVVEIENSQGWQPWQEVDDFLASGESDRHFVVDAEAGSIQFGNGLQGYAPQIGQRIRVTSYRYGGGVRGNVAAQAIAKMQPPLAVKLGNPLPAYGGAEAESLPQGLDRIPGELRRRDRAVTQDDFRELALQTPGATIGRADCLPRYHPQLPNVEAAGVVSVIVWPQEDADHPNAPMPNTHQLKAVCQWLDARRLVTTELYVLPPVYRQVAVSVGIRVKPGYGIDAVRRWVELVIRQFLAPLPPYGPGGEGWPLGRRVHGPELEAAAHQVEGIEYLEDLRVVGWDANRNLVQGTLELARNEVPELIAISVEEGVITLAPGAMLTPPVPTKAPVPVPVIKEWC